MPSRRAQIEMTEAEMRTFLAEQQVVSIATIGPRTRPHLTPLWYVPRPDIHPAALATWTFGKSQKARNLRRLPEATMLVEAGERYDTLRGVSAECDVELIDDTEQVTAIGRALTARYGGSMGGDSEAFVAAQAAKRVGLVLSPTRVASWDHRKLGGVY